MDGAAEHPDHALDALGGRTLTCPRCHGFTTWDEWVTRESERGLDRYCLNCGWRVSVALRHAYSATRVCAPKGEQEEDDFVLRRSGVFYLRETGA
jgi:hypothetical protein